MSVFKRYVEIGRVALINNRGLHGKLVVIVDIADQNRVLIDGPHVHRRLISLKRLVLTDIKIEVIRGAKSPAVKKAFVDQKVQEAWDSSSFGKRIAAKKASAKLNDLQRFELMINRKRRAHAVAQIIGKHRKEAKIAKKATA